MMLGGGGTSILLIRPIYRPPDVVESIFTLFFELFWLLMAKF